MSLIDNLEADGFDLKTLLDPENSQEVARVMQICNACRYCEGFCAVFPAMTRRRHFNEGDVGYLSNLCPIAVHAIMPANMRHHMNLE